MSTAATLVELPEFTGALSTNTWYALVPSFNQIVTVCAEVPDVLTIDIPYILRS